MKVVKDGAILALPELLGVAVEILPLSLGPSNTHRSQERVGLRTHVSVFGRVGSRPTAVSSGGREGGREKAT